MITVAGLSPSLDITYLVESLTPGSIHRPIGITRCAGGKPLNLARAAAALGADPLVIAVLGGPIGDHVERALTADGVRLRRIEAAEETRICVSIAARDDDQLTEVYEHAAAVPDRVWRSFLAALDEVLPTRPGWLVISGAPPRDLPPAALAALVPRAHRVGVRVAVDTHGPALPAVLEAGPDLVKINRSEAAEAVLLPTSTSLLDLAGAVQARAGGCQVVLTDGAGHTVARGADPGSTIRISPPPRAGRFPVGSGDSFLGALLTVLDQDGSFAQALRLAAAAGAANADVPGPGRFDVDGARRRTEEVELN